MGQVIGAVLAESAAIADKAAKLVTVRYEDLPAIMTIEDAIAADRYRASSVSSARCLVILSHPLWGRLTFAVCLPEICPGGLCTIGFIPNL